MNYILRAALASLTLLTTPLVSVAEPPAGEQSVTSKALADALLEVGGDQDGWSRGACQLAFALELGIPEEQVRKAQPGSDFDKLPPKVLEVVRQHVAGLPTWNGCFGDKREMRMIEYDPYPGNATDKPKKTTCEQAAFFMIVGMLPSKLADEDIEPNDTGIDHLTKTAALWSDRLRGKSADERMQSWFEMANEDQRRSFLALVIQMSHQPAYPLLEASFLERAKAADSLLYMELLAYFRHRRAQGKKLYEQLQPVLSKQTLEGGPPEAQSIFFEMCEYLTKYNSFDAVIADFQSGTLKHSSLESLMGMTIDQPWAHHGTSIEPTSVFRPTMEANLRDIIVAAAEEKNFLSRLELLRLAADAVKLLGTVNARTHQLEQSPPPDITAAKWQPFVEHIRELIKDDRIILERDLPSTPRDTVVDIVWDLCAPTLAEIEQPKKGGGIDWRADFFRRCPRSTRSLKMEAVEQLLAQAAGMKFQAYPQEKAAALAAKFVDGNATAWRKQVDALPWDERLLLLAETTKNHPLAHRMWSRQIEFVEWTGSKENEPESFAKVWQDKLTGKKLDSDSWRVLQQWLASEGRAKRYWTIEGQASPARPGISLTVLPTSIARSNNSTLPKLQTRILSYDFGFSYNRKFQMFHITSDGLQEFDYKGDKEKYPPLIPIDIITQQSAMPEGTVELCREGFTLELIVSPPEKE